MDRSEESGWSRQDRQDQEDYNRDNGIANYWYNRGKEEERAKIVALLHEHLSDWCKEETESGDIKHQYHQGSDALERLLWAIEAGEHLK